MRLTERERRDFWHALSEISARVRDERAIFQNAGWIAEQDYIMFNEMLAKIFGMLQDVQRDFALIYAKPWRKLTPGTVEWMEYWKANTGEQIKMADYAKEMRDDNEQATK